MATAIFSRNINNAFLRARILLDKGNQWMPLLGQRVARERIKPQWFNVLRVHNPGLYSDPDLLVVVSLQKPDEGESEFVSLYPLCEGKRPSIKVNPPLPEGTRLYLRTDLRFALPDADSKAWHPPDETFYSISNEDANQIGKYVWEDFLAQIDRGKKQRRQLFGTGGEEEPLENWDSYSQPYSQQIDKMWQRCLTFEFRSMETSDFNEPLTDVTARQQTDTLRRIWADYSWSGVRDTIDWCYSLSGIKLFAVHEAQHVPDFVFPVTHPTDGIMSLGKIENPHPGDPPPPKERTEDEDDDGIDWDESGSFAVRFAAAHVGPPEFTPSPPHVTAIAPTGDIRIVCFDVFGTLVDREQKLKASLAPLLAESAFAPLLTPDDAYLRYIEFEAQQAVTVSNATYRELVEAALTDFVSSLGLPQQSRERMGELLDQAQDLSISEEASHILRDLKDTGVHIVAAPFVESALFGPFREAFERQSGISFDRVLASHSPLDLYITVPADEQSDSSDPEPKSAFGELQEYGSHALGASFLPQQILFVTTSGWRSRLATEAGCLTARLANINGGQSEGQDVTFSIADAETTFSLDGLQKLRGIVVSKEERSAN